MALLLSGSLLLPFPTPIIFHILFHPNQLTVTSLKEFKTHKFDYILIKFFWGTHLFFFSGLNSNSLATDRLCLTKYPTCLSRHITLYPLTFNPYLNNMEVSAASSKCCIPSPAQTKQNKTSFIGKLDVQHWDVTSDAPEGLCLQYPTQCHPLCLLYKHLNLHHWRFISLVL